ncbi:MAG: ABC transporter ATP-binding protein [Sporomusaceae bacterium]|nr:ABC transporter ATP-binding protein [Sporomusaceae bacterium]
MNSILFQDFSFAYQGHVQALSHINMTIPGGSFTAVAGLNGAGKTSLCYAVSGLIPHYFGGAVGGSVTVGGLNTLQADVGKLAGRVGTVLEDYECQLLTITAEEEVAFSLENRGVSRTEMTAVIGEMLQLVGLAGMEKREIASLSGGQKQRLAIAAALAQKPAILVLDEPASALDPEGAEELYALLARLNRETGLTLLIVEHDLERVLPYADQLIVLEEGRQLAAGPTPEALSRLILAERSAVLAPPLSRLKQRLEQTSGAVFGDWLQPEDAVGELFALLKAGGVKIA